MRSAGKKTIIGGSRIHQRQSLKPIHAAAIVNPPVTTPSASSNGQLAQTAAGALDSMADNHAASTINSSTSRIENCQGKRLPASGVDSFARAAARRASDQFRYAASATIVNPA
jgi:hypothetical protein